MSKKRKKKIILNKEMFIIDPSLNGKIEHSMTPEILRMQEDLRKITSKIPSLRPKSAIQKQMVLS
jgi:hypothetical protein